MLGSSSCLNGVHYFPSGPWNQVSIPWETGCCWVLHIIVSPRGDITGVHSENLVLQSVIFHLVLTWNRWLSWSLTLASSFLTFELSAHGSCSYEKTMVELTILDSSLLNGSYQLIWDFRYGWINGGLKSFSKKDCYLQSI